MAPSSRSEPQKQGIDMTDVFSEVPKPPKRFNFLGLPLELRFHVLELLFATQSGRIIRLSDVPLDAEDVSLLPGLTVLQVSGQLYTEGMLSLNRANPTVSVKYSLRCAKSPREHFQGLSHFSCIELKATELRFYNDCNSVSRKEVNGMLIALVDVLTRGVQKGDVKQRRIKVRLTFEHDHLMYSFVRADGVQQWHAYGNLILFHEPMDRRLDDSAPTHSWYFTRCAIIFVYAQLSHILLKHRGRLAAFPHIALEASLGPFDIVGVDVLRKSNAVVTFRDGEHKFMGKLVMSEERVPEQFWPVPKLSVDATHLEEECALSDMLKW